MKETTHGTTPLGDGWFMLNKNDASQKIHYDTEIVIIEQPFVVASAQTTGEPSINLGEGIPAIKAIGIAKLGRRDKWKASLGSRIAIGRARKALELKLLGQYSKVNNNPYMG